MHYYTTVLRGSIRFPLSQVSFQLLIWFQETLSFPQAILPTGHAHVVVVNDSKTDCRYDTIANHYNSLTDD